MARNEEKQISELNRFVIAKENDQFRKRNRPPLERLDTAEAIRRWIPDIKREIDYFIQQIEGSRKYTDAKIREFKQRVNELEVEYKSFVQKALELDPNPLWLPGEQHSYVSKKNFDESRRLREQGEVVELVSDHPLPEFVQSSLEKKKYLNTTEDGEVEGSDDPVSSNDSSDEEILTPLATQESRCLQESDRSALTNTKELKRGFNSVCLSYYKRPRVFVVC